MKDRRLLDTNSAPAAAPVVLTGAKPLERLVRLLARQAAAEYIAELRTREEVA